MTRERVQLSQVLDIGRATVHATVQDGQVRQASFDLSSLPRIEPMLRGRQLDNVIRIVERVCGICPVAHHLAGIQALESYAGFTVIPEPALAIRRMLHHGMVLVNHARALSWADPESTSFLRDFGQRAVTAAGGPGLFPHCAVPGGVSQAIEPEARDGLLASAGEATDRAGQLVAALAARAGAHRPYDGLDVALVNAEGQLDLVGTRLRAVRPGGSLAEDGLDPGSWDERVQESRPGTSNPQPLFLAADGTTAPMRTGPIAQLRAAIPPGPLAREARDHWFERHGDAAWARAVIALHAVEVLAGLLPGPVVIGGATIAPTPAQPHEERTAVGWVDGARGLLVHSYRVSAGKVGDCRITTPTMINEPWLAERLTGTLRAHQVRPGGERPGPDVARALEADLRETDPCVPCTESAPGQMAIALDLYDPTGAEVAQWRWPDALSPTGRP